MTRNSISNINQFLVGSFVDEIREETKATPNVAEDELGKFTRLGDNESNLLYNSSWAIDKQSQTLANSLFGQAIALV